MEAFTAAARSQPHDALRHARGALAHAGMIAISYYCLRWAWPLAARAACRSPDQLGLLTLPGIVVAPYPFKDWGSSRMPPVNGVGEP